MATNIEQDGSANFSALRGVQYINLTTFRKSGVGVSTPVWFVEVAGKIYVTTAVQSGKVKRIHSNPHVQLAPCERSGKPLPGPTLDGAARDTATASNPQAKQAIRQKYGFMVKLFDLFGAITRTKRTYIEIDAVSSGSAQLPKQ